MVVFSATLAISVGVIAFVAAALMFAGPWAPSGAPGRIAAAPAALAPDTIEPASPILATMPSTATAPSKPLAVAVAADIGIQHADKILPAATPRTPDPEPASGMAMKEGSRPTGSIPPRPKKRPREVSRAAYRVQLHVLASDAAVRREWRRLRRRHGALLSGLKLMVSPTRAGAGGKTVYRMQLGALSSRARARVLCGKLRRRKLSCMVVR